jgi:hypothetical protein
MAHKLSTGRWVYFFFRGRPPSFPFSRTAATFAGERERPPIRPPLRPFAARRDNLRGTNRAYPNAVEKPKLLSWTWL